MASTITVAIEQWNQCIKSLLQKLDDPSTVLSQTDKSEEDVETSLSTALSSIQEKKSALKTISLVPSTKAFLHLVAREMCDFNLFVVPLGGVLDEYIVLIARHDRMLFCSGIKLVAFATSVASWSGRIQSQGAIFLMITRPWSM